MLHTIPPAVCHGVHLPLFFCVCSHSITFCLPPAVSFSGLLLRPFPVWLPPSPRQWSYHHAPLLYLLSPVRQLVTSLPSHASVGCLAPCLELSHSAFKSIGLALTHLRWPFSVPLLRLLPVHPYLTPGTLPSLSDATSPSASTVPCLMFCSIHTRLLAPFSTNLRCNPGPPPSRICPTGHGAGHGFSDLHFPWLIWPGWQSVAHF